MHVVTIFISLILLIIAQTVIADDANGFKYRNIGPNRGGRVTAVAGTVAAPSTFYLGATGGGVWKTEDFGTTWRVVSDGYFQSPSIGDISVAQNDPNIVYVGTGSDGLRSNVIAGNGVYKSVDGGDTWEHIGLDKTGHIGAVEIDPTNHNIVWIAAIGQAFRANEERGVFRTTDGGRSWTKVLYISETVGFSDVELLPGNPNVVFAAAWKAERKPWTIVSGGEQDEGGIYKSVDRGATWERITEGLPQGLIGKIDLAISPADSSIVYALVEAPDDVGGLYRSENQGKSFTLVSNEKSIRRRPFYYGNVDVDPVNPDVVYVMANDFLKSEDGGKTWAEIATPHGDNHDMWINPNNPEQFIESNDGGANLTHNGGKTWSTQFNQSTAELYQVEVDDQYPYWLYAGQQDNSNTIAVPSMPPYPVQHQAAWTIITGGCETGPAVPKPGNPDIVYTNCKGKFAIYDKRIGTERRYDVGAANMYGNNPKDLRFRFQRVAPIHVSPHDPNVIYYASQYVHRTTDEGRTWQTISPDLTVFEADKQVISGSPITRDISGEEFYSTIYSLRESSVQPGTIWTGSNDGLVYVTRDSGRTWTNVTPRSLPSGGRIDAVEPSPHDPAKAYIAVLRYQLGDIRPYILRTNDYGRRWTLLTDGRNGLPGDSPVRVVREDPERAGLLFAGTDSGVYVSFDDGGTWQAFQHNLPITPVTDLKIVRGDLVLSTMGRGFWIMDDISPLRQPDYRRMNADSGPVLFAPRDTIRYRRIFASESGDVPNYPEPGVFINYFLPDDESTPLRLEFADASGAVIAVIESTFEEQENDDDDDDSEPTPVTCDAPVLYDSKLSNTAGFHRYSWDMRHFGPWTEKSGERYRDGPLAKPGRYAVRLITGEQVLERDFELKVDPRLSQQDVDVDDLRLQLQTLADVSVLLTRMRQLAGDLNFRIAQYEQDEDETGADDLLDELKDQLAQLEDEEHHHPKPKLINHTQYLYELLNEADQIPGSDAVQRLATLESKFAALELKGPCDASMPDDDLE